MSEANENLEPAEGEVLEEGMEEGISAEELMKEHLEEINEAFTEIGYFKRLGRMFKGLKMPRNSPEYKLARTEVNRLIAPLLAVLCPVVLIVVLCVMTDITGKSKETIQVDIARAEDADDALQEETEQTEVDQTEQTEVEIDIDTPSDMPTQVTEVVAPSLSATPTDQALKAPDPNSVAVIRSPVQMNSVFGQTRSAASRAAAMQKYGGDPRTEVAVVNALRWLKTQQRSDGSWAGSTGADGQSVTGLAILTFLAHGERAGGGEFGECVARGLEWLMNHSDNLDPVGTHALAEAYGFLKNPNLKAQSSHAVKVMVDKLIDTKWGPDDEMHLNTRPMLLKMAFQTMALKSAQMSGIIPGNFQGALDRLKEGFLIQGDKKNGGFSSDYYGPPRRNYRRTGVWHYMVGIVGLQYLGYGDLPIIERTFKLLDDDWEDPTIETIDSSCCPVRGNYWATMVFFNGGGKRWQQWNKKMINVYFNGQTVLKGKYTDMRGVSRDMGYWNCKDMHIGTKPIAPTCWIALQLMVYYRYLPTSSKKARAIAKPAEQPAEKKEEKLNVDIEVDI